MAGRSRSATLIIAYLLWKDGCKDSKHNLPNFSKFHVYGILESVQNKRSIVQPNMAFMDQLVAWDDELKNGKISERRKLGWDNDREDAINEIMKVIHKIKAF